MNKKWAKVVLPCLVVLLVLGTLFVGCGKTEKGKIVITIGHISDMTGPGSTALIPINYAAYDLAKYFNDSNLIPGVKLRVAVYDTADNPSLFIPAWDWLKSKGAKVMLVPLPPAAVTLKTFAEQDEIPIWTVSYSQPEDHPPGWIFECLVPTPLEVDALLDWISQHDWDYSNGIPKIGSAVQEENYATDFGTDIRDYCQAHPDKFQYVAGIVEPMGTTIWSGAVDQLKRCDYLYPPTIGTMFTTFVNQFRDKGYNAKFIGSEAQAAFRGLAVDSCGWDRVDGMLNIIRIRWWNESSWLVDLAKQCLKQEHPADYNSIVHSGLGYVGTFQEYYAFFEVLRKAIEDVGAANFNGQAFYNTALNYQGQWPDYVNWGFNTTKRWCENAVGIYKWSKADQDIVRLVPDWVPVG
jgi:hypothetical protein